MGGILELFTGLGFSALVVVLLLVTVLSSAV